MKRPPFEDGPFKGRTIAVVNDLSIDEQLYLYRKTKELKEAIRTKKTLESFQINNQNIGTYIIFLEDSTRTKESFKNAAEFHNTRLNVLDPGHSSFNKMESYSDTFKMLCGYNDYSIYIVRTKLEGVCRWLEATLAEYAERNHLPKPSFINGGDGKHEHPTQEFLDEYTFFEQKNWNRDSIHIALLGDLFHGRTVHSKADGLRIFHEVTVDLIAPEELQMPAHYTEKMAKNEFAVRTFSSIEEYLKQDSIANIWYFSRLQLERMGEDVREKSDILRDAVTFQRGFIDRIPEETRFYHPLPRHREHPTVPLFLDNTPLNGWEEQALNGYFIRIIAIGMLGGRLGRDFSGKHPEPLRFQDDFIKEAEPHDQPKTEYKVGIKPIENGIVIDHIGRGDNVDTIWDHIYKIRKILDLNMPSSHGVFESLKTNDTKGIVSLPEVDVVDFEEKKIKKLAAIAPGCTLNFIKHQRVIKKLRLLAPPRVYNFEEIGCTNPDCISHPVHHENAIPEFYRLKADFYICKYCEKPHQFKEIWNM
ncbi:MAG: bifunctional aspartate carbamoyltransferase catalytic subunit/aspartate carbamoyltransferase regulatory subunit [Spirochaetales bacterium]|nr:bifunctional aspartate carbamoyltransferase catalytic subunit/aspartate carbamoyltransferase regulatory subunit [Spirochaetales bacterium]